MPISEALRTKLDSLVTKHDVVLFMKGNRRTPQCGFSASVVGILDELLPAYETVDVLSDPAIRDGIKEFSDWPTIPQLYVKGKFVGGADIVREMRASGELSAMLGIVEEAVAPPRITLSDAAAGAFKGALEDAGDDVLRFEVSARYQYQLFFAPKEANDVVAEAGGVAIYLDRASARRADGVAIDFVDGEGGGFKIESPNEPAKVKAISAPELRAMMDANKDLALYDVRTERERAIAKIEGARLLDADAVAAIEALDKATPIVFLCHHGMRSQAAADQLLTRGFTNLYNLTGGIDAWSQLVDPTIARY